MIVVTGATGGLGSQVVEGLLARVPADQVGVSVRDPAAAGSLAARGVRVRHGDFTRPDTLASAFENAEQVLVVSVDKLGDEGIAQSVAGIDAAYAAGAERVLYTSHQAAAAGSAFAPARDHAAVEAHLEATGRPWTSLRNGYYASSLLFHLGDAAKTGELAVPADGPVSWTARDDLAEAAAAILAGEATFDGPTPPLTAPDAVTLDDVAALLGARRVVADDDAWLATKVASGVPEFLGPLLLGTFVAARNGEFAVTDPTLERLIGREPAPVRAALPAA